MEKAYRQPTQPEPISIDTNRESVTLPSVILTSVTLPSDQIYVANEEDKEDINDAATIVGEAPGEGEFYDSPAGVDPDDSDGASSVASSKYQRRAIYTRPSESMGPTSRNIEYGPSKSQQLLTHSSTARKAGKQRSTLEQKRHHSDSKRKPKRVPTLTEQQLLMSSTPADSEEEEEDSPPKLLKKYKTTTV